ncbi:hypothetical protein DES40_1418 [Litorimonas taeanensis]|uniref:Uncharacterized protein n=2 Tax=Litorimonas taeanensis TaxID=568099 RepID=A0A420WM08_9PROT|nr:hypothetical protein DES40_1418 [Litorimonas taeanensis]
MSRLPMKYISISVAMLSLTACQSPQNPTGFFPETPYGAAYGASGYSAVGYHTYSGQPYASYGAQYGAQPGLYSAQGGYPAGQGYYPQGQYAYAANAPYGGSPYAYARPQTVRSQRGINVNYESLNALESPLAFEAGDVTFELRGRIDAPIAYSLEDKGDAQSGFAGNYQVSAQTQLPNRITVGAVYGGTYERDFGSDWDYDDNVAAYAGGSWGTVFGGNVSELVFENTRRRRGVTPVRLAGDGPLGEVDEWSGGYQGRYGPTQVSALVDGKSNYDIGLSYQRPLGHRDYRFTARHNKGEFTAADGFTKLETQGVNAVGDLVYGSTRFDLGVGYERIEDADRWYTSTGISTKSGPWSLSAEGRYGQIEGQEEIAAVLGLRRDIARGLSSTLALDYQDAQVNINGVDYLNTKDTRVIAGLSYGF